MKIEFAGVRKCLKDFDFRTLFREHLGWDKHTLEIAVGDRPDRPDQPDWPDQADQADPADPADRRGLRRSGAAFTLTAVAQKRGFTAFLCDTIPERAVRLKIDHQITKSVREHLIIYADKAAGQQVWQWVRREPGKPMANREHRFDCRQSGDLLIQRLEQIAVSFDEEEGVTLTDVTGRARAAFDVDKVTKKFYENFKKEHAAFLKLVKGIVVKEDMEWYTSLMLNRLMFVYFIQKKGFLDSDPDYLRNRLALVKQAKGKDKFHSFYRYFLLRLFHEGLGKAPDERDLDPELEKLLGKVPYLNGGFFEVHQLEENNPEIDIPDKAFEHLFDFFDQYNWHLDERPLRENNEINPDVVGYIFEKYINQKQMGAYYTKEDITEYISKNTIIPFLFDAAKKKCAVAFEPDSALWRLLRDNPDRYIYPAMRHGVIDEEGNEIPLPKTIAAGIKAVAKRDGWNKAAEAPYALPTETWREHVARRQRCLEVREKLRNGAVHDINDLITLNLDIWQFARDAIVNAEGPELLRGFWHAITKVTVLDPTCGSGAFLFAALRILETLYSDCLERMARFIEDSGDKPRRPELYSDFKKVLEQIGKHPNERYFVLKSIIINNLFGVDIMEEAVEICKLRLFLKLAAQVERFDQIEPLPDIDFNIRAGNTLVGYASAEQVRKAFNEEKAGELKQGRLLMGDEADDYRRFEEDLDILDKAFRQYREQQTTHGGKITQEDKQNLRNRLTKLDEELDRYLAREYGVNCKKVKDFEAWQKSHQPFHWFVDFYGIMRDGGFDVIIGNPPYVEYRTICDIYELLNYTTITCGNLYAFVLERCFTLTQPDSRTGMIVQLPIVCTDRMIPLQHLYSIRSQKVWFSTYDDRPGRLFDGLEHIRATIVVNKVGNKQSSIITTKYNRWLSEARKPLFECIRFCENQKWSFNGAIPKAGTITDLNIANKVLCRNKLFEALQGSHFIYYHNAPQYWARAMTFVPYFWNERDGEQLSTQIKTLALPTTTFAKATCATLNSSLFYWWFIALSDCRHLNMREIDHFPLGLKEMSASLLAELEKLCDTLMRDFKKHAKRKNCTYKATGKVSYDEYFPRHSKPIMDQIDAVLAKHYGFTDEELDFIINYDIKYRMGGADSDEDEE